MQFTLKYLKIIGHNTVRAPYVVVFMKDSIGMRTYLELRESLQAAAKHKSLPSLFGGSFVTDRRHR